jgi:hypothetical protein
MEEPPKQVSASHNLNTEYANNVFFEATVWDIKLIFGEWSSRVNLVDWHTSITVPWAQAKLIQYYLAINVEAHERMQGKIPFPASMIPPEPPPPDPNDATGAAQDFYDMVMRHRKHFIDSLK